MATQFLEVPGGRLAYDEVGAGPLVICAPSMGDVRSEYRFLAPRLVEAGYRVAMVDVRGHGETSVGWNDYSVAAVGADMLALAKALSDEPAYLIGTSMAAGAAVWAAVEAPGRVEGIALVDPFARDIPQPWLQERLTRLLFSAALRRPWGPSLWLSYYKTLYPTAKPADFAEYSARLGANLRERGRLEALRRMMFASKASAGARLDRVGVPTLVVMGTKDPDFKDPEAEARFIAERTHGTLRMIEGAGHYPHAEMPERAAKEIIAFLGGVRVEAPYGA